MPAMRLPEPSGPKRPTVTFPRAGFDRARLSSDQAHPAQSRAMPKSRRISPNTSLAGLPSPRSI